MTAMVVAERVCKDFGALKVQGRHADGRARPGVVHRRPVGLRQVDVLEVHQSPGEHQRGPVVCRRRVGLVIASGAASCMNCRHGRPRGSGDVGMVFQHFNLFPHRTALGNVVEAPIHVKKVRKGAAVQRARELLDRVGMSEKADAYPAQLSGGQ